MDKHQDKEPPVGETFSTRNSLRAKVSVDGRQFDFVGFGAHLEEDSLHAHLTSEGMQNDAIIFRFKLNIANGEHSIGPGEEATVRAEYYRYLEPGKYATEGRLSQFKWDRAGRYMEGNFEFKRMVGGKTEYEVIEGRFESM